VVVDLTTRPASLRYGLVFDPAASDAGRKRADRDGDGMVTVAEGEGELDRLTTELRSNVTVCHGGTLQSMKCDEVTAHQVSRSVATGWAERPGRTLAVTWELRLDLASEDRVVRMEDASFVPDVDRTDAVIEAPEDLRLVAAGQGVDGPRDQVTREMTWAEDRPNEPRTLFLRWKSPAPRWAIAAVVAAVALLMIGRLVAARLRQRRAVAA
jgi:hypothetical protein